MLKETGLTCVTKEEKSVKWKLRQERENCKTVACLNTTGGFRRGYIQRSQNSLSPLPWTVSKRWKRKGKDRPHRSRKRACLKIHGRHKRHRRNRGAASSLLGAKKVEKSLQHNNLKRRDMRRASRLWTATSPHAPSGCSRMWVGQFRPTERDRGGRQDLVAS